MKKDFFTLLIFIILPSFSVASVDNVSYKATFGIFGTVGIIQNKITKKTKTYEIESKVKFFRTGQNTDGRAGRTLYV